MDITLIKDDSLKIKGNKTTIVTDPVSKLEAQIVILSKAKSEVILDKVEGIRLIIEGPGEYEVGGMSVTGTNLKGDKIYDIIDSSRVLLIQSTALSKIQDEDEYDAIVIKAVDPLTEDKFTSLNAKLFILYGDVSLINLKSEDVQKVNKVNFKKTSDYTAKIILLTNE